jgi:hypothetical protein
MKKLFKDNLVIVLSVALPIIVIALFALATLVPRMLADPPAYDLLLVDNNYYANKQSTLRASITVVDERVMLRVLPADDNERGWEPRLYRYDHLTDTVNEVPLQLPGQLDVTGDGIELPVEELADAKISTALRAPDGYEYRGYADSGGGGLFVALFGGGRNRDTRIAKDGAIIRLRVPDRENWYNRVEFLGWITE